jgi:hypothetical protein
MGGLFVEIAGTDQGLPQGGGDFDRKLDRFVGHAPMIPPIWPNGKPLQIASVRPPYHVRTVVGRLEQCDAFCFGL